MVRKTTINKIRESEIFALDPKPTELWVRGKYKPLAHTFVCHKYGKSKVRTEHWISQGTPVYVGFPLN